VGPVVVEHAMRPAIGMPDQLGGSFLINGWIGVHGHEIHRIQVEPLPVKRGRFNWSVQKPTYICPSLG